MGMRDVGISRTAVVVAALVLIPTLLYVCWGIYLVRSAFEVKDQRVVQILESQDGRFTATLTRRHAFLDVNFFIHLNGDEIYVSRDFKPTNKIAMREMLSWDKSGRNLIFEVAGRRLFGYNTTEPRALTDRELLGLEFQRVKPEELGLEGNWPTAGSK